MEGIRTVIWDCDNLMWFHRKDEGIITAKALGIEDEHFEEFSEQFYLMFKAFMQYFSCKIVTRKETNQLIAEAMPILQIYGISVEHFMSVHDGLCLTLNEFNSDTIKLLEYFREKNIKSIIKSDWWRDVQEKILSHYNALDYFEEIHGCDNAYLKSNPLSAKEIVKIGREEQYLIIGDSLESDICFAEHSEIKSIWLNRFKNENQSKFVPTYEVTSLLDVMEIVK